MQPRPKEWRHEPPGNRQRRAAGYRAPEPHAPRLTRPFYWSVRREIWENRSIYIAPLAVAGVVLFGLVVGASRLPANAMHMISTLDPVRRSKAMSLPFAIAAVRHPGHRLHRRGLLQPRTLQNERRDRSILFWKSLPVSDLTTVMAKAAVPLVILPVVTFAVMLATLVVLFLASAIMLPLNGPFARPC